MCLGTLLYHSALNIVLYPPWEQYAETSRLLEVDVFQKDYDAAYAQAAQMAWDYGQQGVSMNVDLATHLLEVWCNCRTYRSMNVTIGVDYTQIVPSMRELLGGEKWGEFELGWVEYAYRPTKQFMAEFHLRFESIHPLLDGNGRWGRLLLVYYYGKLGQTPTFITDREAYLSAMRTYDIDLLASLL